MSAISSGDDSMVNTPMSLSTEAINELQGMTAEEQEEQKKKWVDELAKLEDEIQTLRSVLSSKTKVAQNLKKKLGFSVWKELHDDMSQGIRNVKETNVYQKTESVIKPFAEKTTSFIGGFGSGISSKLGVLKNSESFRSIEEKMGSAYENVLTRVTPSRSNSLSSINDSSKSSSYTPATTPTIAE